MSVWEEAIDAVANLFGSDDSQNRVVIVTPEAKEQIEKSGGKFLNKDLSNKTKMFNI